jgi:dipeptidyl aminopeptidase/acylaminoacyl peptidase
MPPRFTPEFALSLPAIADAQISPDGEVVAFVLGDQSRPSGPKRPALTPSAIWSIPAGGGESRRLTYGRSDSAPRWSPDGRWLAFLSDREQDGRRQVHLLPRDGGEARQLTDLESDIPVGRSFSPLGWFPDGSRVVFPLIDPLSPADRTRIEGGDDRIVFEEESRFWRLWTADPWSGAVTAISPAGLQIWEFAISPDGRRVAAVASDQPYEWDWYDARLVVFDVGAKSTDDVRTIHHTKRQVAKPVWSPDGYEIAFLTSTWSDRGYDAGQPMVVSAAGGEARPVGDKASASDLALAFAPDGRLLAAANVEAAAGMSSIDLETGARTWLWRADQSIVTFSSAQTAGGIDRFAAVIEDLQHPAEVFVGDLVGGQIAWRRLTALSQPRLGVSTAEVRSIDWIAPDGWPMQGFLVLPPGTKPGAPPLPLVTIVHGGPTGAVRFDYQVGRWARVLADVGLAVFVPNYRGSTGWGLEFAESNIADMGGADYADIMSGIDGLIAQGIADGDRLGICGWSYGGYMTAWAIGQTNRFKAAMAGAAITDWPSFHGRSYLHTWDRKHYGDSDPYDASSKHAEFNPFASVRKVTTPTLFLHGELDWDVPVEQAYFMYRALKDLGVETQLVVYPREPHGFSEYAHRLDQFTRLRDWMTGHLQTPAAMTTTAPTAAAAPTNPTTLSAGNRPTDTPA